MGLSRIRLQVQGGGERKRICIQHFKKRLATKHCLCEAYDIQYLLRLSDPALHYIAHEGVITGTPCLV